MSNQNPENRPVALVTGGKHRIGKAIVEGLVEKGWAVAIHGFHYPDLAKEFSSSLNACGHKTCVIIADLLDTRSYPKMIAEAQQQLGPVQLLVNNASLFQPDSVTDLDLDRFRSHFAIHVEAPSFLASEMAKRIGSDLDGLVINMTDQRVNALTPHFYSYTLSKSALWTATQTMAMALAPQIRVNAIAPGPTLSNPRQKPEDFQKQVDGILLKRSPKLEEFANTIQYLWENRSITGQMIALDGGQHLAWETPDVAGVSE